eukprot:1195601-Prorocentrum_minimum.AAC.3
MSSASPCGSPAARRSGTDERGSIVSAFAKRTRPCLRLLSLRPLLLFRGDSPSSKSSACCPPSSSGGSGPV